MSQPTIAATLGQFITDCRFDAVPVAAIEAAKGRILDCLACSFAGSKLPWSQVAVSSVAQAETTGTLIGQTQRAPYADAAFVNGVQAHSILQEDTYGGGHPSTFVVPAVLAVGEELNASGRDVLLAIVLGYELCQRISMGEEFMASMKKGFRGSLFGAFGAAAGVGKLMGLNATQQAHALGLAANFASGLTQTWWSGSMDAVFAAGQTARVGIQAAVLARAGGTAAAEIFEGPHGFYEAYYSRTDRLEAVTRDLGVEFGILKAVEKPFPACAGTQIQLEMGLAFARAGGNAQDIERVVETDGEWLVKSSGSNAPPPYQTMFQAQMSHQFCIAAALLGRPVHDYRYFADHYDDAEVASLAARVQLVPERGRKHPSIVVHLREGDCVLEADKSHPRIGHFPTLAGDIQRFHTLAAASEPPMRRRAITDAVAAVDRLASVRSLMALLSESDTPQSVGVTALS